MKVRLGMELVQSLIICIVFFNTVFQLKLFSKCGIHSVANIYTRLHPRRIELDSLIKPE